MIMDAIDLVLALWAEGRCTCSPDIRDVPGGVAVAVVHEDHCTRWAGNPRSPEHDARCAVGC